MTDAMVRLIHKTVDGMEQEIVGFLVRLVRAPSVNPPGDTTALAAEIQEELREFRSPHELHSSDERKPNVILRAGTRSGKVLCFNSHMDTVPVGSSRKWKHDPFGAEILEGNLYGRGSADAKGCSVAMLMAVRAIEKAGIQLLGQLDVAIASDEETGGAMGTQWLLENGVLEPNFAVIGEITSNRVAIAEKGMLVLSVTTSGRTAHASTPWEGVSAISSMARLIRAMETALGDSFEKKRHPLTPPPSYNFGLIEGGVAINVVPDECRMTMDRRTLPGEALEEAEREIAGILDRLKKADATFEADYSVLYRANAFETPPECDLVRSAARACGLMGLDDEPIGYQQVSDGRFFADRGIPTVLMGPGTAELAHTPDEHVPVAAVVEAVKLYALAAIEILGAAPQTKRA
jgi:succinyl-diaminopimelate desuccinylase